MFSESCAQINVFVFNDVEYVGLESRRLDYEADKAAGKNKIEKALSDGVFKPLPADYDLKNAASNSTSPSKSKRMWHAVHVFRSNNLFCVSAVLTAASALTA